MSAVVVTDTPYFAVSDQNGNFVMEQLPTGHTEPRSGMKSWAQRRSEWGKPDRVVALDLVFALKGSVN